MMKKHLIFLISVLLLIGGIFVSCSDSDDDGGEDLVTHYGYKLNQTLTNSSTSATKVFHRVSEFHSVDNGDNTYNVRNYALYYFAVDNSTYSDLSGSELIGIVKAGNIKPDSIVDSKLSEDKTATITTNRDTANEKTYYYYLPSGLEYKINYYY